MNEEMRDDLQQLVHAHNSCVKKLHATDVDLQTRIDELEVRLQEMTEIVKELRTQLMTSAIARAA
jgi:hypothetical protein